MMLLAGSGDEMPVPFFAPLVKAGLGSLITSAFSGVGRNIEGRLAGRHGQWTAGQGGGSQHINIEAQKAANESWQSSQAGSQGQSQSFQAGESAKSRAASVYMQGRQQQHEKDMLAMEMSSQGQNQGQIPHWMMTPPIQDMYPQIESGARKYNEHMTESTRKWVQANPWVN